MDVKSRTTKPVAPLIGGISGHENAAASDSEFVVVGGRDGIYNPVNSAELYDLATDT